MGDHKYDAGKPYSTLCRPGSSEAVGVSGPVQPCSDPEGWKRVEPERYTSALMRHLCSSCGTPQLR